MSKCVVSKVRALMARWSEPLAALVVPSADAHNSEYLAACDARRAFLTGFTGSAGTAVVTEAHALLWTDGRYYLQAERELRPEWTLMRESMPGTPTQAAWLCANLGAAPATVGADPALLTHIAWRTLAEQLAVAGHRLVPAPALLDQLWVDRPARPALPVRVLSERYAGQPIVDKLTQVRAALREAGAAALVVSALDDVAWLLNLRGSDIPYNPVFFAYMLVSTDAALLFTDESHLTDEVRAHLAAVYVETRPYEAVVEAVEAVARGCTVLWFGTGASHALTAAAERAGGRALVRPSPVALLKAVKNATEVAGMRAAHVRDSAALCRYLAWLEERMQVGDAVTEVSGAQHLEQLRAEQSPELYLGPSFETISAAGANAAIVHYRPGREAGGADAPILAHQLYLVDSGAQYLDGTTDVTRTVVPGGVKPGAEAALAFERRCFTLVLRGQLRLGSARFPVGVLGNRLDSLARQFLWDAGLDYQHGTGHGVGHYLCVHEGPQGVSWRACPDDPGLAAGMCISNEPGYYESGAFGIRHENVAVLEPAPGLPGFLHLDTLTLVPIQTAMVDIALLDAAERDALNVYHARCLDTVTPELERVNDERALSWLRRHTEPI